MLSKSFQSCTPSPYGYSPCLGESAGDDVECIHCLSLRLLAQAAAFGRRPKGSVKPTALSPRQGDERNKVKRRGWRVFWTTAILFPKSFCRRIASAAEERNGIVNLFGILPLISIMLCYSVYLRLFLASLHSLILQIDHYLLHSNSANLLKNFSQLNLN